MQRKSAKTILVQRNAGRTPRRTVADMARLDAAMHGPVDTSDIPDEHGRHRVLRDPFGHLPQKSASPIRDAILAELERRQMTRNDLWKAARKKCPSLPESAVYEFLRGQRQIGVAYIDALLLALGLVVTPAA